MTIDIKKVFTQIPKGRDKHCNIVFSQKFEFEGVDLVKLRDSYGVSQQCVYVLAGGNKSFPANLETCGKHAIQLETMLKICHTFGILEGIRKAKKELNSQCQTRSKKISSCVMKS